MTNKLPFNEKKIGHRLRVSGEHKVFKYGKNEVIKFPAGPIFYFKRQDAISKIKRDHRLIKTHLKKYTAQSEIHYFKKDDKGTYCIIQEFIKGRPLEISDLNNKEIKKKFKELVERNNKMIKEEGFSLEFFGIYSLILHFFLKRMDNVIVAFNNKLYITDLGLISKKKPISSSIILSLFIKWAYHRQKKLLQKYIKEIN